MAADTEPRVLLVEDDDDLRLTTRLVLERHGFTVGTAADGVEALARLAELDAAGTPPAVAIVDIAMPRMDGITFARKVHGRPGFGIIMLTARELPHDQLASFEAGADDYVIKPFDGDVLAARIHALLRRLGPADAAPATQPRRTQRLGDLIVDRDGMTVQRASDGTEIALSGTEFRLLGVFLDRPGRVVTRPQLLDLVWGIGEWGDDHVVEVSVARLRAKIGAAHLQTVRGVGYKLVDR